MSYTVGGLPIAEFRREVDNPSPATVAKLEGLTTDSDFTQVPFLIAAVFWARRFKVDRTARFLPQFERWAVDNADKCGLRLTHLAHKMGASA